MDRFLMLLEVDRFLLNLRIIIPATLIATLATTRVVGSWCTIACMDTVIPDCYSQHSISQLIEKPSSCCPGAC